MCLQYIIPTLDIPFCFLVNLTVNLGYAICSHNRMLCVYLWCVYGSLNCIINQVIKLCVVICLQGQVLSTQNDKTIRKSDFDVKKQTKVIIHGFIDTPLSNWVKVSVTVIYN
jgi:hypothetical protein